MEEIISSAPTALQPYLQISSLEDLYDTYKAVPYSFVLAGFCLFVASQYPELKNRFLLHFWITFLSGFGGGTVTALLIMDPNAAPISLLANNTLGTTWLVSWWLVNYTPFNVVGRLHSLPPIKVFTKACVAFLRANLIINRVDLAVSMFPGVIMAPLVLGTLSGSGGKLVTDGIRGAFGLLTGPVEASVPTFVWRSAALVATGYWGACKATSLLTSEEAAALVITVLLVHSVLSDLLGHELTDFTYPVGKVLHTLSLVPMPSAIPAPIVAKASKKPTVQQQAKQQAPTPAQSSSAPRQPQDQQAKQQATSPTHAQAQQHAASSGKSGNASKQQQQQQQQQGISGAPTQGSKAAVADAAHVKVAAEKVASMRADSSSKGSQPHGKRTENKKAENKKTR